MPKKVLDVGQCDLDNSLITDMLRKHFDVEVQRVGSLEETLEAVGQGPVDLVLINRILDADGSEGMDVLQALKGNETTAGIEVMVVSNFETAQETAVAAGATMGFGKAALNDPATVEMLSGFLG